MVQCNPFVVVRRIGMRSFPLRGMAFFDSIDFISFRGYIVASLAEGERAWMPKQH